MHTAIPMFLAVIVVCVPCAVSAVDMKSEFRIKPAQRFAFAEKPTVTGREDAWTIRFAATAPCDATVAVEDAGGRTIRHIASGVLGANAPAPFKKDSLVQELAWDGKDDLGRYVDNKAECSVRVSLGLKAQFERQLNWSPFRRICNQGHAPTLNAPGPFVAQSEGVYVFDGSMHDHLRLFSHEGEYLRTVYPFPSDKLEELIGVKTQVFPQSGKTLPLKGGNYRSTLLTSGTNREGGFLTQLFGLGATAMAVHEGRVALACNRLNRMATDGTTGGLQLEGPETRIGELVPRSAAFSPDGKTLYLTGFNTAVGRPNWRLVWIQGVARIDFEKGKKMEPFAGVLSRDRKAGGTGPGKFRSPVSVATDPQGRVYVADRFNDRIQIFDPSGRHLKDLSVPGGDHSLPSEVVIDQRNGDIYVFSWYMGCHAFRKHGFHERNAVLFHFGPFEKPVLKAQYSLPIPDQSRRGRYGGDALQGREFRATIDPWASDGVGVWLVRGSASGRYGSIAKASPVVLRVSKDERKLEVVKDFGVQAGKDLPALRYWGNGNRWLAARPTTGELYLQYGRSPAVFDPATGKGRIVRLPMEPISGGMYFDWEGQGYLRHFRMIARFALSGDNWREVPFDYGEERGRLRAVVPIHTGSIHGQPGFSVSVNGDVVAGYITGKVVTHDRTKDKERAAAMEGVKRWKPLVFPGRGGNSIVRVWDRHGKVIHEDAVRGVGYVAGIFLDRDGALYVASEAQRQGYFDPLTGTFVKFRADEKILSTGATVPLKDRPADPPDTLRGAGHKGRSWWKGADWFYGGMGYCGKNNSTCHCPKFQSAHDYFARSFVPETGHYSVAVLDAAGNLVLRVGQYGSVDDGVPLFADGPPVPNRRKLGGDEIGLFYPAYLATHTDRRLFIHDPGNARIVSARLDYHTTERMALKGGGE